MIPPMRAALLCPGPSLAAFDGVDSFDAVIAVNRAVYYGPCTHWTMLDKMDPEKFPAIDFAPTLITRGGVRNRQTEWSRKLPCIDLYSISQNANMRDKRVTRWRSYSATASVIVAFEHLKVRTLEVWGRDLAGDTDWDGDNSVARGRTPDRWKKEGLVWKEIEARYNERLVIHAICHT